MEPNWPSIGTDLLAAADEILVDLVGVDGGLVVEVLEQHVLQLDGGVEPGAEPVLVKQVAHLNAGLGVFVGIEGGDAALGGAEGLAAKALLLVGVLKHVVGHQELCPLGNDEVGGGDALIGDALELLDQLFHIQRHAVADDVGDVRVESTGGEDVEREAPVVVDDGVTGVRTALKADDDVRRLRQHVGDLALALVAPVGANDRFDHNFYLRAPGFATALRGFALSAALIQVLLSHSAYIISEHTAVCKCFFRFFPAKGRE